MLIDKHISYKHTVWYTRVLTVSCIISHTQIVPDRVSTTATTISVIKASHPTISLEGSFCLNSFDSLFLYLIQLPIYMYIRVCEMVYMYT